MAAEVRHLSAHHSGVYQPFLNDTPLLCLPGVLVDGVVVVGEAAVHLRPIRSQGAGHKARCQPITTQYSSRHHPRPITSQYPGHMMRSPPITAQYDNHSTMSPPMAIQ